MSYKGYDRDVDRDFVALIAGMLASSPVSRDGAVVEAEKIVETVGIRAAEAQERKNMKPFEQERTWLVSIFEHV